MGDTNLSPGNIARAAFNDADKSIITSSFISAAVGNKIEVATPNSVTEVYSFYKGATLLYTLTVIYTDSTKAMLSSVERTA